jgi:hypothetical protein
MTYHRPHASSRDRARSARPAAAGAPPRRPGAAVAAGTAALPIARQLARVEQRLATRRQQIAIVLAMLAAAGAALAAGRHEALAIVLACVSAEIILATSLLMLTSDRHARMLELIVDGHGDLSIAGVARERRRLLTPSHRAALARSLHDLADEAPVRLACPTSGRPLYTPLVLTALRAELHAAARLLARDHVAVAGVALTERLLTAHDSPLYGTDDTRLRQELHRITFALQSAHAPSHADPDHAAAGG